MIIVLQKNLRKRKLHGSSKIQQTTSPIPTRLIGNGRGSPPQNGHQKSGAHYELHSTVIVISDHLFCALVISADSA